MLLKKTLILSLVLHATLLAFLMIGLPQLSSKKNHFALEAKMMFKKKSPKAQSSPPKVAEKAQEIPKEVLKKPVKELKNELPSAKAPSVAGKKLDFSKELARLTKGFKADVAASIKDESDELPVLSSDDGSYFEQIYYLIKKSFVVPPHINGPAGKNLMAVLRLFLSADGNLSRIKLEHSSGDEHFDKAVMEGTKRVNNFGPVPLVLQSSLSKDGLVVEMCPFTCASKQGG